MGYFLSLYSERELSDSLLGAWLDNLNKILVPGTGLQIRVRIGKLFSLFLIQNICCGYSKELSRSDVSFEHPKHMFKLISKKIIKILRK